MPTTATRLITAAEYMAMPERNDGLKDDLVRGEIVTMSHPKAEHGLVQGEIYALLRNFVKPAKLGWVMGEVGVQTEFDPDTVRGPDVFFVSIKRCPTRPQGWFTTPPDLVVEVLSPGDRPGETRTKVREYLDAGVPLIWVVDPQSKTVMVHAGSIQGTKLGESEPIDGGTILPGFSCVVADFFAD